MKKKNLILILISTMIISLLVGCSQKQAQKDEVVAKVAALKGPTAMGMVKMIKDNESKKGYEFSIDASPDIITPKIVKGEVDIAAVPANLASVLYNNTKGEVATLAINTLGVLYIAENGDSIKSIQDLKGKTIYLSGKGATPEYALNYILKSNNIDPQKDVNIQFKSEHTECLTALSTKKGAVAMLPQPFVTTATLKNPNIKVALDLNKEWENINKDSSLLTGVIVAKKEFIKNHPEKIKNFLNEYQKSVEYTNKNVEEASKLIEKNDIVQAAVAKVAIPNCNITFISGNDMKSKLEAYLNVLFKQNPKAVGGKLPDEEFYYNQNKK